MKFYIFLTFILLLTACKQDKKPANNTPAGETQIEFRHSSFDFGDMAEGEIITHTFYFKNTGKNNLIIKNIDPGCGCTTVDYEKAPLKPGKEGKLEIAFNSSGRYGKQYKEIRIFANVPEKEVTLKFIANVKNN